VSFCAKCETYLTPDAESCPSCGTARPQTEPIAALWTTELGEPPAGPPLVFGELLLVPTRKHGSTSQHSTLRAFNLVDGNPRWQQVVENGLVSGLGITSDGFIVFAASSTNLLRGEGMLLALDERGNEHWRWATGAQYVSAPAMTEKAVCFTVDARTLIVLDLADGAEQTRIALETNASLSAPVVVSDVAFVPCRSANLLAVGLDGHSRWRFDAQAPSSVWLDRSPVVVEKCLFATLSTGIVLALRTQDGSPVWQTDVGPAGKRLSPLATDGERLYIGASDGLHALNLADGQETWNFTTASRIMAAPVVASGVVYATCRDHHLYALNAATGQELWRYEVKRRIEVSPIVTSAPEAGAFIADRGGTLTAIARPLSATEYQAAKRWIEAASAYAALGELARGAELLETHGESYKAAEIWLAAGEQTRAAEQYEAAGAWQRATELWGALGRPLKRANALEEHARSLADGTCTDEEQAAAWATAAQAFEVEGEVERAAACQRKVARFLRRPIITLDVQHEGLVQGAWSRLMFVVRNDGYGSARNLIIRARGEEFEGQVTTTRQIATLRVDHERTDWLDVRPRAYGDSVPLRVSVEYTDWEGQSHTLEQTIYIPVARTEITRGTEQRVNVIIQHGDYVAGDKTTGVDQRGQTVHEPQTNVAGESHSSGLDTVPSPEATRLHRILSDYLDLEEFRTLCFDIGVKYDHLGGEGLAGKARELVLHLQQHNALTQLIGWLNRQRPDIEV
jgi:outer membrane protein assembly factor BamB